VLVINYKNKPLRELDLQEDVEEKFDELKS